MSKLLRALIVASSILLGLALGELYCRSRGLPFPRIVTKVMANTPAIFQRDDLLGWRLQPGRYQIFNGKQVTILDGGTRTSGSPAEAPPDVLVLGCSYTMGWGLTDGEDYTARLHASHPALTFRNYGTPGYGAYQSLLLLEQRLRAGEKPKLVLYGMVAHHEVRSHGDPGWAMMVASMPIPNGGGEAPYAALAADGTLERHGPLVLPPWPLESKSSLVGLAKMDWFRWRARDRMNEGRAVTQRSLLEMKQTAEAAGARFVVVLLDLYGPAKDDYLADFKTHGIDYLDCAEPIFLQPEMRLADHIHPNEKMHARYAACISRWLDANPISAR